jgi:hypothetical protein
MMHAVAVTRVAAVQHPAKTMASHIEISALRTADVEINKEATFLTSHKFTISRTLFYCRVSGYKNKL